MNRLGFGNNTNSQIAERISREVPRTVQLQALIDALPNGVRRGNQFFVGSLNGEAGQSLRINIDINSPWFLNGNDFQSGEGVGGISKILMAAHGWKMKDVADHFRSYLSHDYVAPPENPVKPNLTVVTPTVEVTETTKKTKMVIGPNTPHDGEYTYTDADGVVIVSVRKYLTRDESGAIMYDDSGKAKKEFRQFVDGRISVPEPRPLYNIPNILASDKVIWVEGEKCADALTELGLAATCTMGGTGMLNKNTAHKFDFSPLKDKQVILWPDNDQGGKELAQVVEEQAMAAGAKSTIMLRIPTSKPEKWDAADAIDEEFDINKFIQAHENKVKKTINLFDESLLANNMFEGKAPEQKFLIADTMPLGVPVVFAAAGDSGKGMMTLDLAMKVASGGSMLNSFGGNVAEHGDVILFTAEDDKDEMHRRIARLDPMNYRATYDHKLLVLPLPNLGGVFPIMQKVDNSYEVGPEFDRIYDQMLEMDNLKLIVIDPLASFVHADVNADPAAGAAFMGLLAQMATETGATVIVNHHMAKVRDDTPITKPEQARNLIRGTSAIVDGVRSAFVVWSVDEGIGKQRCRDLNVPYTRNAVFDGAVVKSNGPANREIRHFIRNPDTGLLEDRSVDIRMVNQSSTVQERMRHLVDYVRMREDMGRAVTASGSDGIFEALRVDSSGEPCVIFLKNDGESTLRSAIQKACELGQIRKYALGGSRTEKWLGTLDGSMSIGDYQHERGG
jgi:5S rRNA maturation endonuclease (ribonuclease M5)